MRGPLFLIAATAATFLWRCRAYGFIGWDTYPMVAASRFRSLHDFWTTFTEPVFEGYGPYVFYRPIVKLTIALDHALWGMDPLGYYATNVAIWAVTAAGLWALATRLFGTTERLGAWAALATFVVARGHADVVAGPVSRRGDLLCGAFVVWALVSAAAAPAGGRRRAWRTPLLVALAILSKETGVVALPLVVLLALRPDAGGALGDRLRAASGAAAGTGAVLLVRHLALGSIGGHAGGGALSLHANPVATIGTVGAGLLFDASPTRPPGPAEVWLGAIAIGVLAALVVRLLRARGVDEDREAGALLAATLGLTLLVGAAGLCALVELVVPWYLYVPGIGLALIAGAVAQRAAARWPERRPVATVAAIVFGGWLFWQAWDSPLVRSDPVWVQWSRTSEVFFQDLAGRIATAPGGAVLRVAYPAAVLRPASIQAWADLTLPDRPIRVRATRRAGRPAPADGGRAVVVDLVPHGSRRPARPRGRR